MLSQRFFKSTPHAHQYSASHSADLLNFIEEPYASRQPYRWIVTNVENMLNQGANPNQINNMGDTLIHLLINQAPRFASARVYSPNDEIEAAKMIDMLERHGADLLAPDSEGRTPWFHALLQPHMRLAIIFVNKIIFTLEHTNKLNHKMNVLMEEADLAMQKMIDSGQSEVVIANHKRRLMEAFARKEVPITAKLHARM